MSTTTSASARIGSSRRRSSRIELAIPRSSASGWRWRVSEKRRIRTSSRASRNTTRGRTPRPSSAPRIEASAIGASPAPHVDDDRDARKALAIRRDEVGQLGQQLGRQVVDDGVAEVLEELRGGGLAAARQAAEDDDVLFVDGRADRRFRGGPWLARHLPVRLITKTVSSNRTNIVMPSVSGLTRSPPGVTIAAKIAIARIT